MSEPVWYYARGEVEKGPLSTIQIKALAAAGKIRPDDYVWKEGMESWLPAGEAPELFPAETAKSRERSREPESPDSPARTDSLRSLPKQPQRVLTHQTGSLPRMAVRSCTLLGLILVLTCRSCDRIGERYVQRLEVVVTQSQSQFQGESERQRRQVESQIAPLQAASRRSPANQENLRKLSARLAELDEKKRLQETQLEQTVWKDMRAAAVQAEADQRIACYWREWTVLWGTLLLTIGLIALGYTSEGPERWACCVALVVVFYVATTGSLVSGR